jgi:hypothetical protein
MAGGVGDRLGDRLDEAVAQAFRRRAEPRGYCVIEFRCWAFGHASSVNNS